MRVLRYFCIQKCGFLMEMVMETYASKWTIFIFSHCETFYVYHHRDYHYYSNIHCTLLLNYNGWFMIYPSTCVLFTLLSVIKFTVFFHLFYIHIIFIFSCFSCLWNGFIIVVVVQLSLERRKKKQSKNSLWCNLFDSFFFLFEM